MTDPSDFRLSSDYATLKNDGDGFTTVTVPGSFSIGGYSYAQFTADLVVGGSSAGVIQTTIQDQSSGIRYTTSSLSLDISGTVLGSPASYNVFLLAYRLNNTTVRSLAFIPNPYDVTLTTNSSSGSYRFSIATFLPEFNV